MRTTHRRVAALAAPCPRPVGARLRPVGLGCRRPDPVGLGEQHLAGQPAHERRRPQRASSPSTTSASRPTSGWPWPSSAVSRPRWPRWPARWRRTSTTTPSRGSAPTSPRAARRRCCGWRRSPGQPARLRRGRPDRSPRDADRRHRPDRRRHDHAGRPRLRQRDRPVLRGPGPDGGRQPRGRRGRELPGCAAVLGRLVPPQPVAGRGAGPELQRRQPGRLAGHGRDGARRPRAPEPSYRDPPSASPSQRPWRG